MTTNTDIFRAARVGLGALGIVVRVTIEVVPKFKLHRIAMPYPLDQLMLDLPVPGLDLRLDEDIENQSSFNEGREVLFKDVIKGLGDVAHSSQPGCGSVTRKELVGILTRDKL